MNILKNIAKLCLKFNIPIAKLCLKFNIPIVWFTPSGVKITQEYSLSEPYRVSISTRIRLEE